MEEGMPYVCALFLLWQQNNQALKIEPWSFCEK